MKKLVISALFMSFLTFNFSCTSTDNQTNTVPECTESDDCVSSNISTITEGDVLVLGNDSVNKFSEYGFVIKRNDTLNVVQLDGNKFIIKPLNEWTSNKTVRVLSSVGSIVDYNKYLIQFFGNSDTITEKQVRNKTNSIVNEVNKLGIVNLNKLKEQFNMSEINDIIKKGEIDQNKLSDMISKILNS